MTYSGLKFLYYLRRLGHIVYPFDDPDKKTSRLHEVYPSHTWSGLGLSRSTDIKAFAGKFSRYFNFPVSVEEILPLDSQDAADAVVACVTLAYALYLSSQEHGGTGNKLPAIPAGQDECSSKFIEGLVVRTGDL